MPTSVASPPTCSLRGERILVRGLKRKDRWPLYMPEFVVSGVNESSSGD